VAESAAGGGFVCDGNWCTGAPGWPRRRKHDGAATAIISATTQRRRSGRPRARPMRASRRRSGTAAPGRTLPAAAAATRGHHRRERRRRRTRGTPCLRGARGASADGGKEPLDQVRLRRIHPFQLVGRAPSPARRRPPQVSGSIHILEIGTGKLPRLLQVPYPLLTKTCTSIILSARPRLRDIPKIFSSCVSLSFPIASNHTCIHTNVSLIFFSTPA